jgi:hypothetical protein
MLETVKIIQRLRGAARLLDPMLIDGNRATIVGRNLGQIEERGVSRSRLYVHRLAGKSSDVPRKSRTESWVEFIGASAFEQPERFALVREFLTGLVDAADMGNMGGLGGSIPRFIRRDFWEIDEESSGLMAARRTAYMEGNHARVMELTARIEANERDLAEITRVSLFLGQVNSEQRIVDSGRRRVA